MWAAGTVLSLTHSYILPAVGSSIVRHIYKLSSNDLDERINECLNTGTENVGFISKLEDLLIIYINISYYCLDGMSRFILF